MKKLKQPNEERKNTKEPYISQRSYNECYDDEYDDYDDEDYDNYDYNDYGSYDQEESYGSYEEKRPKHSV